MLYVAFIYFDCVMFSIDIAIEGDINDGDLCGLIPRTSNYIFDTLNIMGLDYSVKVSFLEICKYYIRHRTASSSCSPFAIMTRANHQFVLMFYSSIIFHSEIYILL